MTPRPKFHFALATMLTTFGMAGVAFAEETQMEVDPGASAPLDVLVTLSSPFGTDSDTDSMTTGITSSDMRANPTPDAGPFTSFQLLEHDISTSGGLLYFEFYCSFIGCVANMDVTVHALSVTLVDVQTGGVNGSGTWALPTAVYEMDIDMSYSSGLLGAGDLSHIDTAEASITGTVELVDGILIVKNITMDPIHVDIPQGDLPTGISALSITVDANFDQLIYRGEYGGTGPPDGACCIDQVCHLLSERHCTAQGGKWNGEDTTCDSVECDDGGDNVCDLNGDGLVNGADLTMLLGGWGNCCVGDIDESGSVDGADLTMLLGCWTG